MRKEYKILLVGAAVLTVFDVLATLPPVALHFSEEALLLLTFLIYFATAYEGARLRNYKVAVLFSVLLAVFDATAGFGIAVLLGPKVDGETTNITFAGWLENLTVVAIVAALIGLMAGGIVKLMVKRKE